MIIIMIIIMIIMIIIMIIMIIIMIIIIMIIIMIMIIMIIIILQAFHTGSNQSVSSMGFFGHYNQYFWTICNMSSALSLWNLDQTVLLALETNKRNKQKK